MKPKLHDMVYFVEDAKYYRGLVVGFFGGNKAEISLSGNKKRRIPFSKLFPCRSAAERDNEEKKNDKT